ncbi:hypothetical protein [Streptomyces sp. Ag109_G2-15]|uniref:effector-associated constant component EACC1 n=1 Tax=Streptomyces sp. Ag109_G2-15 TaxID=1938850 RepID=UPI000BDBAFB3|nr:hypothetical protein [Streptomyces sp. Ag109_G2-15]SOE06478.1 hypothetical protein SAMN06272765_7294 [Streptomyces sp. Ag109_G2-15]
MSDVLRIRVDGTEEELQSFAQWLSDEPDIRYYALISWESPQTSEGEMGSALELVKLVIDSGFQMLNLGLAYVAWRGTRPTPSSVTVERAGVKVTLNDSDPEAIARLIRALEE